MEGVATVVELALNFVNRQLPVPFLLKYTHTLTHIGALFGESRPASLAHSLKRSIDLLAILLENTFILLPTEFNGIPSPAMAVWNGEH